MESTLKFDKTNLKLRIVFFLVGLLIMALGISIIAILTLEMDLGML